MSGPAKGISIRQELPADYPEVRALVRSAFATGRYDGEAEYLDALRGKPVFLPELSLVAEEDERIVGQVVLYETPILTGVEPVTALVLSPLSVHPAHFRRGIARALVERALDMAREMGYPAVFLCGEPALYQRLGFVPSHQFGIHHADHPQGDAPWCMVRELRAGALDGLQGTIDIV